MALKLPSMVAVAVSMFSFCPAARAEQFVLVDEAYTHSTDTTKDSHYYPALPADTPKNWQEPIDYAGGSVHIVLDVKTKPAGDAPTRLQICFEATPSYACTAQSPTYTKAGRVEWDSPFEEFWYESTVDWAQGIKESPLILKDDMNNKPAGDPKYMPTDLYVQVTLVSKGATFVPPPVAGSGGVAGDGSAGAGGMSAAAGQSGAAVSGAGGGAQSQGGAGAAAAAPMGGVGGASAAAASGTGGAGRSATPPSGASGARAADAGLSTSVRPAAAGVSGEAGAAAAPTAEQEEASSGCLVAGRGSGVGWLPWALAAYWATRARRRARPATSR